VDKTYGKMREILGLSPGEKLGISGQEISTKDLKEEIRKKIESCQTCNRTAKRIVFKYIQRHYQARFPFESVNVDLFAFKRNNGKFQRFIILTDTFTRFLVIRMIEDKTPEAVSKALIDIFYQYGFPSTINSDRGKEFNNELLKEINKLFSVKGVLTAPYSPNQFIERSVQEPKRLLKVLNEDFDDFNEESIEQYLRLLERIMNNRTINTLGASPFSLFYGRKFNMNIPEIKENETPFTLQDLANKWLEIHQELFPAIRERISVFEKRREEEDKNRFPGRR
jgi:hypothetical protein